MGKVLHKAFKTGVKEILQYLPHLGESSSEVYYLIPEPRNFSEVKNEKLDKGNSKGDQEPN